MASQHKWTRFEKHLLLCLLCRNIHIDGVPIAADQEVNTNAASTGRKRKSHKKPEDWMKHAHMDVATALNRALNYGDIAQDIDYREVSAMIHQLMSEKKAAVKFMERQKVGRLTRLMRKVWQRGLKFTGDREEWKGGRREEVLRLEEERASGKFTQVVKDVGGVGLGWGDDGMIQSAESAVSVADPWGEGGAATRMAAQIAEEDGQGGDVLFSVENQPTDASNTTVQAESVDLWGSGPSGTTAPIALSDNWGATVSTVIAPVASVNLWVTGSSGTTAPVPSFNPRDRPSTAIAPPTSTNFGGNSSSHKTAPVNSANFWDAGSSNVMGSTVAAGRQENTTASSMEKAPTSSSDLWGEAVTGLSNKDHFISDDTTMTDAWGGGTKTSKITQPAKSFETWGDSASQVIYTTTSSGSWAGSTSPSTHPSILASAKASAVEGPRTPKFLDMAPQPSASSPGRDEFPSSQVSSRYTPKSPFLSQDQVLPTLNRSPILLNSPFETSKQFEPWSSGLSDIPDKYAGLTQERLAILELEQEIAEDMPMRTRLMESGRGIAKGENALPLPFNRLHTVMSVQATDGHIEANDVVIDIGVKSQVVDDDAEDMMSLFGEEE